MTESPDCEPGPFRDILLACFKYSQAGKRVPGVAHELNNGLGAIISYAELIAFDPSLSNDSRRMLENIINAARKSSSLTTDLAIMAGQDTTESSLNYLGALAARAVALLHHDVKKADARIDLSIEHDMDPLLLDSPHVLRAICYLVTNALEALRTTEDRRIRVSVESAGDSQDLCVWDAGGPIPQSDQARIFDAFHTTKDAQHMGLGLSVAKQTAEAHQGSLHYEAKRGFVLRFSANYQG